ncbi:MAG: hypothetical protein WBN99_10035 [Mycobacterium sp.]|nr:hypothetical protein [Mycobacterium sp.]
MDTLIESLHDQGLACRVVYWDDPNVDWTAFTLIVLRSPWSYVHRRGAFSTWLKSQEVRDRVHNPPEPALWSLDKRYLLDLEQAGIGIVPTVIVPDRITHHGLRSLIDSTTFEADLVLKPSVGASSSHVRRFAATQTAELLEHHRRLQKTDGVTLLQGYLPSVDTHGEVDLVFFDGQFSHAIRKASLLHADGRVDEPTMDKRATVAPSNSEIDTAAAAFDLVERRFSLDAPLLYGRVDLLRTDDPNHPLVLEMEICEPSLSLGFSTSGGKRFAACIAERL